LVVLANDTGAATPPPAVRPAASPIQPFAGVDRRDVARVVDVGVAGEHQRLHRAAQHQRCVDVGRQALRVADPHLLAVGGDVEVGRIEPGHRDHAAELDRAGAKRGLEPVEVNAIGIEGDRPVDVGQRLRNRDVRSRPSFDLGLAAGVELVERADERGAQCRLPAGAQGRKHQLQNRQAGVAAGGHVDGALGDVRAAGHRQAGVLALQLQLCDFELLFFVGELQRTVVGDLIVVERQRRVVHGRVDEQFLRQRQRPANLHRAADNRARVRRHLRRDEAQVRDRSTSAETELQVGVVSVVHRDAARAEHLQASRRGVELLEDHRVVRDLHLRRAPGPMPSSAMNRSAIEASTS
jgi:hypothetical protein